ncbi:hypothetical protein [Halorubrum laminariae]|uniref:Uncharacterized protein n=1 Tax=Halorubrum laminariae TaxID=1433523 RepID=A0ABD6C2D1_9EURY|nr:hypothetical protein [Halorubrum laminariae]
MVDTPRRRVLAAAATGTTLSLAGCSSLGSDGTDGSAQTDDAESADDASATAAVDIQSDLQAAQNDIRQRLQEGNLTQSEAQAEIRETQLDLLTEAVSTVESYASDTEGLTVSQTNARAGAVLVSGAPAAVLSVLDADSVSALLSAEEFPEPEQSATNGTENDSETDSTNDSA